jgi:ribose 1,5-bisphosphate isomerase
MELSKEITQIIKDIEEIKIQGATAVAEACFEGIKIYIKAYEDDGNFDLFMANVEKAGLQLVHARPNEPLARNGLKYLINMFKITHPDTKDIPTAKVELTDLMNKFMRLLDDAKKDIVEVGVEEFIQYDKILTHCHSSTVENICAGIDDAREKKDLEVIATETRPRYQGRITSKNLLERDVDVKLIVDSAVTSFLAGAWDIDVDAVFIGCDQIMVEGDTINKVGSFGVALASYYSSKPIYVVGTLMKLDPASIYDKPEIEMRSSDEIWDESPEDLQIINPAFEIIPNELLTGFVTEFGIIEPNDVEETMGKYYEWIW